MITVTIEGGAQLRLALVSLENKLRRHIMRDATRAALKPVLTATKAAARSVVGGSMGRLLALNVKMAKQKKRLKPFTYAEVVRMKSAKEGAPARFWYKSRVGWVTYVPFAIEYGHGRDKERASRPFLRPSFHGQRDQMIRTLQYELGQRIEIAASQRLRYAEY